jgi:hypothetical protein
MLMSKAGAWSFCRASRSTPQPPNFAPISQLQLARFKGETWERFGDVISGDVGD